MNTSSQSQEDATARATPGRRVLAAVISYNPDRSLLVNLEAIRKQVEAVLVIDNGSKNLPWIQEASSATGAWLVSNATNRGIASALNQAVQVARERGFDWLATFDQDSLCPAGAIDGLLTLYRTHPCRERIGVLAFSHRDRATRRDYHRRVDILVEAAGWRGLRSTITSGCLVPLAVFEDVGTFDDSLFIDSVDHDFCLRARKHGWLIIESLEHVLEHSIGNATERHLLGVRVVCTHHSALRRYYMTRNQLEVSRRNLLFDPIWSIKGILQYSAGAAAALLFESDKLPKLGAMLAGLLDFMLRRFGPRRTNAAS
jgi:rhamnosyltransferase